tara:strand:- start:5285 stop:5437 length:153 start_codon:yes stop_codon:yes gene_type:complete
MKFKKIKTGIFVTEKNKRVEVFTFNEWSKKEKHYKWWQKIIKKYFNLNKK